MKTAYVHRVVLREAGFDCLLLTCGGFQVGGVKMHKIKLIYSNWALLKQAPVFLHYLKSS